MSNSPRDSAENAAPDVRPIEAPSGIDLHPAPRVSRRISKRVAAAISIVVIGIFVALAYGGYRREVRNQAHAREAETPKGVTPALASAREVEKDIPVGNATLVRTDPNQLQPPTDGRSPAALQGQQQVVSNCGFDPRTGQPYRFNPETGQACAGSPQDRVVVRQPAYPAQQAAPTAPELTPEQRRIAAAYQRELDAMAAPTGIRSSAGAGSSSVFQTGVTPNASEDLARIAALTQNIADRDSGAVVPATLNRAALQAGNGQRSEPDYEAQNNQTAKASFYYSAPQQKADDYLKSTRTAPISPYEIKAGWEISAVLEQSLNSDLPGEIKALVTSSVFDTATGRYLLIPQGARLIGKYDSRISYGQDGVQVVWDRIIFPDASSVDINGMAGLDAHGNSGLRYDVDHHYKRLLGFTVLTSAFEAAFGLSQRNSQSALTYPSVRDTATASVGRDISETGASITRRNLNVQPTIKVPAGYKFLVRVNRDILFDAPYAPLQANPLPGGTPGQLHPRTAFPISADSPRRQLPK